MLIYGYCNPEQSARAEDQDDSYSLFLCIFYKHAMFVLTQLSDAMKHRQAMASVLCSHVFIISPCSKVPNIQPPRGWLNSPLA